LSELSWVDPKKWGKRYAEFAIARGKWVVFETIGMLEKADPADPWYGMYREQLKYLLMSEYGRDYERFRDKTR
jgi:hypothetical protein